MAHLTSWTCECCSPETACEVTTEDTAKPSHCPYNLMASWHQVTEGSE